MKIFEVFFIFLRLGLTSFGGPVAHLGYFHNEFVVKRKWLGEAAFADLVALCQLLPGPASSQVGLAIGASRAGLSGAIAAWIGFTLPSAFLLVAFAFGISALGPAATAPWLHGLKIVAVAVVANALWMLAKKLCPDATRAFVALVAAVASLQIGAVGGQLTALAIGALAGTLFIKASSDFPHRPMLLSRSLRSGFVSLAILALLLIGLPVVAASSTGHGLAIFDSFFRTGSLVFGGGHVVLPLLKAEVVDRGWVSSDAFMVGYGAAQAVPGPLFSFAAYLGAMSLLRPSGITGAAIALIAIFLPSFLLIFGVLPFWEKLRTIAHVRFAMVGVNAAVVGLLAAALYSPVWTSAIFSARDAVAAVCYLLLLVLGFPAWAVVILGALVG